MLTAPVSQLERDGPKPLKVRQILGAIRGDVHRNKGPSPARYVNALRHYPQSYISKTCQVGAESGPEQSPGIPSGRLGFGFGLSSLAI